MVEIKDFADDRGHINWPAFRQARRDAGEECEHCGGTIAKPNGEPTICWNCRMLDPNVVVTDWSTRCPECDTMAAVAEALGCGVNDLPLHYGISWFEQKARVAAAARMPCAG